MTKHIAHPSASRSARTVSDREVEGILTHQATTVVTVRQDVRLALGWADDDSTRA